MKSVNNKSKEKFSKFSHTRRLKILGRRPLHSSPSSQSCTSTTNTTSNIDLDGLKKLNCKTSAQNSSIALTNSMKTDSDGDDKSDLDISLKPDILSNLKIENVSKRCLSEITVGKPAKKVCSVYNDKGCTYVDKKLSKRAISSSDSLFVEKFSKVFMRYKDNERLLESATCSHRNQPKQDNNGLENNTPSSSLHTEKKNSKRFLFLNGSFEKSCPSETLNIQDEEEDIIVVSKVDKNVVFSFWDIRRVVKNIVSNVMLEDPDSVSQLTPNEVAKRMKSLYHQDFTNRLPEISQCLDGAKIKHNRLSELHKEVQPGLRQIDLDTLNPMEWLNDIIINKYFELLVQKKPFENCSVSSFFYEEVHRNASSTLPPMWYTKQNLLIPVCLDSHWSLLCALPREQVIKVYSSLSLGDALQECCGILLSYLEFRYNEATETKSNWTEEVLTSLPRQQNEYDCGVYVCMFARSIVFGLSRAVNPTIVTCFRNWIKSELKDNQLKT